MLPIIQTWRDFREFVEAKKRKREPIRWRGKAAASASYKPSSTIGFSNFRVTLRGVGDWGPASENVDKLEDALRRRHSCTLPLPRKVLQNSDCSISLFWDNVMVRCFIDGVSARIGGSSGISSVGISTELLDVLGFQYKLQGKI